MESDKKYFKDFLSFFFELNLRKSEYFLLFVKKIIFLLLFLKSECYTERVK